MTATPNLNLTHLASNSSQPEVPVNAMADGLDNAMNGSLNWNIIGDVTCTQAQLASAMMHKLIAGSISANFNFGVPSGVKRLFAINNQSGFTVTVRVSFVVGATATLATGSKGLFYTDGTDVVAL